MTKEKTTPETDAPVKPEIVSLTLEVKEVTPWEPEMVFDVRQIIRMSDKRLVEMRDELAESRDEAMGNTTYDEIAIIRRALLANRLVRDGKGKIVTQSHPQTGQPTAQREEFNLDDQRIRNRLIGCIEDLKAKMGKKKSITIEFQKHAELIIPSWDDAVALAGIMKTVLNEQESLGTWIIEFHSKISTMEKEATDLVGNKK